MGCGRPKVPLTHDTYADRMSFPSIRPVLEPRKTRLPGPGRHLDQACLRGRLGDRLRHDNLYHTVLGIVDVATPTYRPDLARLQCNGRGTALNANHPSA